MIEIKTCSQREPCWTRSRRSWPRRGGGRMSSSGPGWLTSSLQCYIWKPVKLIPMMMITFFSAGDSSYLDHSPTWPRWTFLFYRHQSWVLSINQTKPSSIKYPDKLKEAKLTLMNYINQPVGKLITFWICDKQSQRFFQRGQRRPLNTAQNQTRHPKKRWLHIFTGGQLVTSWPHNNSASHR